MLVTNDAGWYLQLVPSKPFSPASGNLVHRKVLSLLLCCFSIVKKRELVLSCVEAGSLQVLWLPPQSKDMCTRLVSSPQLSAGVSGSLINHTLALGATLPLPHISWDRLQ